MHDGMRYGRIDSKVKVKVTSPSKFEFLPFSTSISSAIYNGSWQMTTNRASAYGTPLDGATVKVVITTVNKT